MTSCGGTSSVTKEAAGVFQAAWLGGVGYTAEINAMGERLIWPGTRFARGNPRNFNHEDPYILTLHQRGY